MAMRTRLSVASTRRSLDANPNLSKNHQPLSSREAHKEERKNTTTMKIALALTVTLISVCTGFVPKATFTPKPSFLRMAAAASGDAKVCLVTGSSQGIGKAIALELAKNGQKLVINHIKGCEEDAAATVEEVKALGGDAIAIEADCKSSLPMLPMHVESL